MARDISEYTFQHNGVNMKKVLHNGTVELWSADVPDVIHSLDFNYTKDQSYYDTGTRVTLGTIYTSVDLSQYSGVELTLTSANLTTCYQWSDAYLYLTDGTTDIEIAHMSLNADDEPYQERVNLNPALTFGSTEGTANISIVLYVEEMNELTYGVKGGTLKLIGRKG